MDSIGSAPTPDLASSDELTSTFGVLLIGFIFSVVLYGLTFFQTYIYYTRFPADHMGTKSIVGALWAMDTGATTLISHTIYNYLITNFLSAFDQLVTTKTFVAELVLAALLVLVVQCYYAFRVWSITDKQVVIPLLLALLALASCALNLASVASIAQQDLFAHIVTHNVKLIRGIASALSVVADFVIVGAMLFYMQPARNPGMVIAKGWFEKTVVFGFNRGTVFTAVQTLALIIFLAMPTSQAWILVGWVASKIYVNSLLAMLNFRNTHRGRGVHEEDSLNQAASNRSGSHSAAVSGARDTNRSVQFSVNPDAKPHDPMSLIELDMVGSPADGFDDETGKATPWLDAGGPSKRRDFDEDSSQ
ncbi:hypothetical protein DICSQDRAFT_102187 [Dichomitus squalens LYAD-421 SS1]|uniref:uncharacterized protein n=1 Tax=Dichomitus squalens (strain LYAD-421) TaxID=732165 RepID=UPI0004416135|nr:uncharacterized protein DICSQDRAFT_102187 [Dichomitus squalens LYAD-421 SS1]EJF63153.1 hypothetical protein DICSQDRAFT_102187 [Dichomitus squalens LYAD-421 SS1]